MGLNIGDTAPDFILPSTKGTNFNLAEEIGNGLILYFYPKDFTRGCTVEACSFRDDFDSFRDLGIKVVGVSTDSIETHLKFQEAHNLPFELLSDYRGDVSNKYGALVPWLNISKRITFLIDKDLKIREIYNNPLMARNHIRKMIEAGSLLKPKERETT